MLLQGGGALGSYQAGVYEALAEASLHPDSVAGISIGAINSAIIAGNAPAERVEKLRTYTVTVTCTNCLLPMPRVSLKVSGEKTLYEATYRCPRCDS